MEIELTSIYVQLKVIRESIVKLGPSRRTGSNFDSKLSQAKALYDKFKNVVSGVSKFSDELTLLISRIEDLYVKTIKFERETEVPAKMESRNLEKFSLKTAVSLLPKMNGDETVTQDLIEAISLYSSMLEGLDNDLLIKFVLTTRLTQGARMRLASQYATVDSLLADMKKHLLTAKSDVAIQAKLARTRQDNKSIADFGAEIERLMVDLTISQAGDSQEAYRVLRPLNEKYAVKKFSDGLRNQRLGTIITARNLTLLKDAIRVAEDENGTSSGQVMTFQRQYRPHNFSSSNRGRGNTYTRNNHAQQKTAVERTFQRSKNANVGFSNGAQGRDVRNATYRGRRGQQNRRNVACFDHTSDGHDSGTMSKPKYCESSRSQFFRD
ncbi:uncharacterized protein LOC128681024 [Plodia interpunctella]|uniref:uncharacterized protein LOC128681024 n=1 Tax=Plodia interpunctella TaxID=58824 RepID=UPI0023680A6F|nr:uncharacterized protein LOC128681024 [Plodia interpunctella]